MTIRLCGYSLPGAKEKNDDHFCLLKRVSQEVPLSDKVSTSDALVKTRGVLAAVADGMGSYQGGALASRTVLHTLSDVFYSKHKGSLEARVTRAIRAARSKLQDVLRHAERLQAGTTLAGVALKPPDQLVVFHIGDSRVIRFQNGALVGLTIDHTPIGKPLALGRISLEKAMERNDAHQLTRSLGLIGDTRFEIRSLTFAPGDRFLLTTDGVCSPGRGLDPTLMAEFLDGESDLEMLLEPMLWEATERDGDNATLVFIQTD